MQRIIDLPGFGLTGSIPKSSYTFETYFEVITALSNHLNIEEFSINDMILCEPIKNTIMDNSNFIRIFSKMFKRFSYWCFLKTNLSRRRFYGI